MVVQADEALAEALIEHIEAHSSFAVAVAHRDLLVNGEVMPASNAVVRDISTRLHVLGIGAIRVQRGLTTGAIGTLVGLLARRATADDLLAIPDMQGIMVARIDFQQLGLADEASLREEGQRLWRSLAERLLLRLTKGEGDPLAGATGPAASGGAGTPLVSLLQQAATSPVAAAEAFSALNDLVERASMAPRAVRDMVGAELQQLFAGLDDDVLVATLKAATPSARARFSAAVVDMLPSGAMIRWLAISAQASGRELSPHLVRLVTKMSTHQGLQTPETTDQALRETVLALVQGWEVTEPNPEEHHVLLDTLAEWSAQDKSRGRDDEEVELDPISHEAIRLVQMACELDFLSEDAVQAARHLADHGFTSLLLGWAEQETTGVDTRARLRELAITPTAVNDILLATPFDPVEAKHLLEAIPDGAASLLIGPLEHCDSRAGRRLIYDRLHRAGAAVDAALRERLQHPAPWYLARNLLGLVRDIAASAAEAGATPTLPSGPLLLFQSHEHPQVRREAVRILALYPPTRGTALRRALDDASDEVRITAIETILGLRQAELPREVSIKLLALADQESLEVAVREKAVRAAAASMAPAAHDEVRSWLLAHSTRRGLLKGIKLAPVTPLVRTALQLLAAHFARHEEVAPVLTLARRDGLLKTGAA